jgi:hypothetical protein
MAVVLEVCLGIHTTLSGFGTAWSMVLVTMKLLRGCALALAALAGTVGIGAQLSETVSLYANAKPYMNDPLLKLKIEVTDLSGLKADANQESLPSILNKAGDVIMAQMPRVPNLIAQEDVAQEIKPKSGYGGIRSVLLHGITQEDDLVPRNWRRFEYLILAKHPSSGGTVFDESRKEIGKAHSATPPRGVGFGSLWLAFVPSNLYESHFRYLGTQKVQKQPTVVVAFAQDPKLVKMPGLIEAQGGQLPLLYQGVVWIDQQTYRIVRIRTDLLAPLPRIQVNQLSSTLSFSEVKIPHFDTLLWLPEHVEITWDMGGNRMGEFHRYSKYGLFRATSRILPN